VIYYAKTIVIERELLSRSKEVLRRDRDERLSARDADYW